MTFLRAEITMFEQMRTIEADTPIPIALETEVVVARVGQVLTLMASYTHEARSADLLTRY